MPSSENKKILATTTTNNNNDDILDRYRQLTAKSLLKLHDSCQAHDFFQYLKHNMENDFGRFNFQRMMNDKINQQFIVL